MHISRRAVLAASVGVLPLLAAGCSALGNLTPASVAQDVNLIAQALPNILAQMKVSVPAIVATALSDLVAAAQAIASAETTAAAQPIVQRVAADVMAVAAAVLPLVPGGSVVAVAIQAAQALIPAIETAVGLVTTVSAVPAAMSASEARLILAGDAAR